MNRFYAQLDDDDVCVAVSELSGVVDSPQMIERETFDPDLIGKRYDREADEFVVIPPAPVPPPVWAWFIDIGPFFDRFGAAKMAVLTSSDAGVKALLADIQIRKWVDLQNVSVAQGVAYIGSVIAAVTPAMQAAILTTPVDLADNLALRRLYFGA